MVSFRGGRTEEEEQHNQRELEKFLSSPKWKNFQKRSPTMPKTKKVKKSKAVEVAEFRAEVQKYMNTGHSSVLTDSEKSKIDASIGRSCTCPEKEKRTFSQIRDDFYRSVKALFKR